MSRAQGLGSRALELGVLELSAWSRRARDVFVSLARCSYLLARCSYLLARCSYLQSRLACCAFVCGAGIRFFYLVSSLPARCSYLLARCSYLLARCSYLQFLSRVQSSCFASERHFFAAAAAAANSSSFCRTRSKSCACNVGLYPLGFSPFLFSHL